MKGLSRVFDDRRMRTGLMLVALLASFSVSGYVLAMMFVPSMHVEPHTGPIALGNFTMALDVNNVNDLYAWQVAIVFNSTQIKMVEAKAGDFMKAEYPLFLDSTDTVKGLLLLYGGLKGNVGGQTGSGRLVTIVFEYYVNDYGPPSIVDQVAGFDTWLENSELVLIPEWQTLLTLSVVG